ncbi:MAG TPA: hypothetical protein ENK02_02455 [Planctomycetes bacterium]|nr:hypothetical protein [Planctomycetota bacterium]
MGFWARSPYKSQNPCPRLLAEREPKTRRPLGLILFAAKLGKRAAPWGSSLLDPQTSAVLSAAILGAPRSFSLAFHIPQDPALIGFRIPFQGLAQSRLLGLRLSNAQGLQVRK